MLGLLGCFDNAARCRVPCHLRFFFQAGVHAPLCPADVDSPYGYPCEPPDCLSGHR